MLYLLLQIHNQYQLLMFVVELFLHDIDSVLAISAPPSLPAHAVLTPLTPVFIAL